MKRPRIDLDAEPTWTPGPNPHVRAFAAAGGGTGRCRTEPFARDVRASKGSPLYRAHAYHTKVPPEAITPYIDHYTSPGDTVFDPFCGSGMTGAAALRAGRRALLCDLSPLATFLAYNHCTWVDPVELREVLEGVLERVRPRLESAWRLPCPACGAPAGVRYVVWSDVLRCPACGRPYVLWDAALDASRRVRREFPCPRCGGSVRKQLSDRIDSRPVAASLDCRNGCDAKEAPLAPDVAETWAEPAFPRPDAAWFPADPIPAGLDELSRVHRSGVRTVADLFTPRNLETLAALWDAAQRVGPGRLRARALFAVTAILVRASRLIKYIPSRRLAPGPIPGTMYLPSFAVEVNALELFRRRIAALCRAATDLRPRRGADSVADLCISTQDAGDLSAVPDASIDYVFTDPPFGHNILYSDLNFLWESWLGWRTDVRAEAVVSRSQGKGVAEYGELMAAAFAEIHRVLKPGRWLTLVFHNTRADVWGAIQRGLETAGFRIDAIQTLDKLHETFKQVTAEGAVGYDVVVNCRKAPRRTGDDGHADPAAVLRHLLEAAPDRPCRERTARYLHARLTGELVRAGVEVTLDYKDVLSLLREHFVARGRYWWPCRTKKPAR